MSDSTRSLREAIDAFAADHAPELVEEARDEALAKVRGALAERMAESLLARSREVLERGRPTAPPADSLAPQEIRGRDRPTARPAAAAGSLPPTTERPAPSAADPPRPEAEAKLAHYVYGVVSPRTEMPAGLAGVDPRHEVFLVEEEGLAALVSRVSLAEFGERPLHDNLNDVGWLEEKARAHEHVLDVALRRGVVVPLRLCTIYSGEEQVREMLDRECAVMMDALERLEGRAEWGVKAIAEPGALERAASERAGDGPEQNEASRGAAYMNQRRREARAQADGEEIAHEWATAIHDLLADAASEALLNPIQRAEVSGHEGDMLLNGVYLVEDDAVASFSSLVDRLAEEQRPRGVAVELTGPWPPYNFVKSSIESAR